MGADNWTENENARIDASGFDASVLDADFTIRYAGEGIPLTIVYSDGVDVYIAESDEATATTWSWENITKVFDGVSATGKPSSEALEKCKELGRKLAQL